MTETRARAPHSIEDCDEALVIMSAELQVAEITGDTDRCEDIRKFMDQALDIRCNLAAVECASPSAS